MMNCLEHEWHDWLAYQDELDRNAIAERDAIVDDSLFDSDDPVPSDQFPVPFEMMEL